MNLKDLENIASRHVSQVRESKKYEFDAALKKGMRLLSQAHSERFQNPDTLKISCHSLIDAITCHRMDIRPYLALAYLFSILEDFKTAEEYAYAAMKIDPGNTDVATFIEKIQAFKKEVTPQAPLANKPLEIRIPDKPPAYTKAVSVAPNYHALFAELETFILEKLKDLFSTSHSQIEPTVNLDKYKVILKSYENLNHVIKYMEQQVKIIVEKLNVSSLQEKMAPFMMLKNRYANALKISRNLMEIHDTIELWSFKTDKQVQVVNQNLTMSALTYGRVDVDRMMDGCDWIADQLDHLAENEKIDISLVESSYSKLLSLVESLNDMVDDSGAVQENQNKLADILS